MTGDPPATFDLTLLPDAMAVCRLPAGQLPAGAAPPAWLDGEAFVSLTRTPDETSVVCGAAVVPAGVRAEFGWRALRVAGPLDFALTGVLLALLRPLAAAGVSVFAVSTFDTDYVLVREAALDAALVALRGAGHRVAEGDGPTGVGRAPAATGPAAASATTDPPPSQPDAPLLTPEVRAAAARAVLCWLATADAAGRPNVSPKEAFAVVDDAHLAVANIASPGSAANVAANPHVCVGFVDVFVQKGFKVRGVARDVAPSHPDFARWVAPLRALAGERFPIRSVFVVRATAVEAIVAPSYWLFPDETTEASQVRAALRAYGVVGADEAP